MEDVVDGLLGHCIECFLEEARYPELEFHKVSEKHHQVLAERLELIKIGLNILQLLAVLLDAGIYLVEKNVILVVKFFKHLLTTRLLAYTEFIINSRNMKCRLESTQVWKHS